MATRLTELLFVSYDISGEVVCRQCYVKKFGCSAFALSGADMLKLLDTTTIKTSDEDKDSCPRCQGKVTKKSPLVTLKIVLYMDFLKVFHAERIGVKEKTYHKRCASCVNCTKPLSSRDLCEGKDGEIYCKSCYSRKYGAPGYRGIYLIYIIA